jgi:hypothetical protein
MTRLTFPGQAIVTFETVPVNSLDWGSAASLPEDDAEIAGVRSSEVFSHQ